MNRDLKISGKRVVTADGVRPAVLVISEGKIVELAPYEKLPNRQGSHDAGEWVVMPGVVDTHVHINEPGRAEWEGFESATDAASAGGITTLVDMPLNSMPVTTSAAALHQKIRSASGRCRVDLGFWGGVVPGNSAELAGLHAAGALGFKAFLIDSGLEDFPHVSAADLKKAMPILAELRAPLLVHAELDSTGAPAPGGRVYRRYLDSRPKSWENDAVDLLITLCRKTRCPVHIVHLSSAQALPALGLARSEGLPITAETCPHYLHFAAEDIPDGRTEFKCAPPIREKDNREALWEGLEKGLIDCVVSDHSPCTPALKALKDGDFSKAWGGISSLQFLLPAVWTGARQRGHSPEDIARWLCEAPARLAGLENKGRLEPGRDADIVIWDPEASFTVKPETILHRHALSPYAGETLFGKVHAVYLRGRRIGPGVTPSDPAGKLLLAADHRLEAR